MTLDNQSSIRLDVSQPCALSKFDLVSWDAQAAMLMYPFAKLRQMAKDKIIKSPEKILDLPITAVHALELVEENAWEIAKELGDESPEMLKSAMMMMDQRYAEIKAEGKRSGMISFIRESLQSPSIPPSIMMVAFGDKNSMNELVYGIAIDRCVTPNNIVSNYFVRFTLRKRM